MSLVAVAKTAAEAMAVIMVLTSYETMFLSSRVSPALSRQLCRWGLS